MSWEPIAPSRAVVPDAISFSVFTVRGVSSAQLSFPKSLSANLKRRSVAIAYDAETGRFRLTFGAGAFVFHQFGGARTLGLRFPWPAPAEGAPRVTAFTLAEGDKTEWILAPVEPPAAPPLAPKAKAAPKPSSPSPRAEAPQATLENREGWPLPSPGAKAAPPGVPIFVDREVIVTWASQRGIPTMPLDLAVINARRKSLGLPAFALRGGRPG